MRLSIQGRMMRIGVVAAGLLWSLHLAEANQNTGAAPGAPLTQQLDKFDGVYFGTFSSACDLGEIAILVLNGTAIVMGYASEDGEGFVKQGVPIQSTGVFSDGNIDGRGTSFSGTFTASKMSGNIYGSLVHISDPPCFATAGGSFSGPRLPESGPFEDSGGFYTGSMSGVADLGGAVIDTGAVSGSVSLIVSANGQSFTLFESLYDFDVLGPITADEGGTFTIASDGSFNTTLSLGLGIDGSLDDANFTVVGTLFENATDGTLTLNTSGTWTTQRDEPLPAPPPPALKWKRERLDVGHLWRPLTLNLDFVNPVVIAGPPTANEAEPGVIRVRQAQSDMPEVRFQEWSYLDGLHLTEDTAFAIFEAGREEMPDGSIWEVGTFPLGGTGNWQPEFFTQPFPEAPAVFLTVQTTRGTAPVTVRARDVTATGFDAALFEEESEMSSGHSVEEIGYLAVYSPRISGTVFLDDGISIRGFPYLLQMPEVDDRFVPVHAMSLRLEEEQSQDVEVRHTKESVAVLTLGPDVMFAQQVSSRGRDTTALRRLPSDRSLEWGTVDGVTDEWVTIPIRSKYSDAVVVAKPASFRGADPGVLQQRRGPGDDLQVRFKEWDYLDGSHGGERVFYLVAPAAGFSPGNLRLRAGKLDTSLLVNDGVETVTFPYNWSVVPALFTSVMTANDSDPVTTRVRNLSSSGFEIAMQEEEAKGDGHLPETLGWIAIEKGSTSGLKRNFTVLGGTVGDDPTRIPFSPVDRQFPVIIADVNSFRGFDPVTLRYRRLTQVSVDLLLQEEQSFDAETRHTSESVSIFVAE